ncbi:helix-turn-helix domain-containing protein [Nocardioides coralli]|uniref:helix-turn-helix domain-containing protein n=1 Tax=Nocardioides coralli TaxID=2872154 RepID=UPI001CA45853|nr:GAF domain-containing protein [Nocardioides coralli]QZY28661.1 helix-turn-helix domain-containing protein [Nocardioides coralli]
MSDPRRSFLQLLYEEAPRSAFDQVVADAVEAGVGPDELVRLREEYDVALRLRELIARQQAREAEMRALYETANDLTAIRDVDTILAAIVRRARQLLQADMTYLSLNDEAEGASYMKVTEGALTPEFKQLRLPLGTGLLGLVAQTGEPYFTEDYQSDERFVHRGYIDEAVAGEGIRAILGVPLVLEGRVIGALLAVHRSVRPFPPHEVTLLTSFAAHAAVALENAQLFADLDDAHRTMTQHTAAVEAAALAHDRLTDLLVAGGGVEEVADVMADVMGGPLAVLGPDDEHLAGAEAPGDWSTAAAESVASGRAVRRGRHYVTAAQAGTEHVATLVLDAGGRELDQPALRTLERGALVTSLVILFARTVAETEDRLGGELLADLLEARPSALPALRERARRRQVVLEPPLVVAVAAVTGLDRFPARRALTRLAAEHQGLAGDHLGRLVLLVPGEDPLEAGARLAEAVAARGGSATVGVCAADPDALGDGHAEARRCLETLLTLGRVGEVSDPAGLGVTRLLLGDNDPEHLATYLATTLGPVLAYDEARSTSLVATLEAWFATGGTVKEAAARLHVHPNTVSQRLERITGLLGPEWREPERALDLQLALRVHRLRRSPSR